jgi:hypothetical protein
MLTGNVHGFNGQHARQLQQAAGSSSTSRASSASTSFSNTARVARGEKMRMASLPAAAAHLQQAPTPRQQQQTHNVLSPKCLMCSRQIATNRRALARRKAHVRLQLLFKHPNSNAVVQYTATILGVSPQMQPLNVSLPSTSGPFGLLLPMFCRLCVAQHAPFHSTHYGAHHSQPQHQGEPPHIRRLNVATIHEWTICFIPPNWLQTLPECGTAHPTPLTMPHITASHSILCVFVLPNALQN